MSFEIKPVDSQEVRPDIVTDSVEAIGNESKQERDFLSKEIISKANSSELISKTLDDPRKLGGIFLHEIDANGQKYEYPIGSDLEKIDNLGGRFEVNFQNSDDFEYNIGAGNLLPSSILEINVTQNSQKHDGNSGEVVRCIRRNNPRPGYYDINGNYVPIFTGDIINITAKMEVKDGVNTVSYVDQNSYFSETNPYYKDNEEAKNTVFYFRDQIIKNDSWDEFKREELRINSEYVAQLKLTNNFRNVIEGLFKESSDKYVNEIQQRLRDQIEKDRIDITSLRREEQFIYSGTIIAKYIEEKSTIPWQVTLGQASLESGFGRHAPGNNLFGIKASRRWRGESNNLGTTEVVNGQLVKQRASFRGYGNQIESYLDYARFLNENKRYQVAFQYIDNPKEFLRSVIGAGYATLDKNEYVRRVDSCLNRFGAGFDQVRDTDTLIARLSDKAQKIEEVA